jgi:hypothetical protein
VDQRKMNAVRAYFEWSKHPSPNDHVLLLLPDHHLVTARISLPLCQGCHHS